MSLPAFRPILLAAVCSLWVPLAHAARDLDIAGTLEAGISAWKERLDTQTEAEAHDELDDSESRMDHVDQGSEDGNDLNNLESLLEYGERSRFWHAAARALTETVLEQRKKELAEEGKEQERDVNSESFLEESAEEGAGVEAMRVRRTVRFGVLDDHQRQALAGEDTLVRKAILGALGKGESVGEFEELMSCAKTVGGGTEDVEKAASYVMQTTKLGEPTLISVARDAWKDTKAAFKELGDFFTKFLKWSVSMSVWPPSFIPSLSLSCAPLHRCAQEMAKMQGNLLKFFGTLIYGIFRVLLQMLKSVARFFGAPKRVDKVDTSPEHIPVQIAGKAGKIPPKSAIDDFVKVHNSGLLATEDLDMGGCYVCQGSLSASIKVDPLSVVKTILTGGVFGMLSFSIGSAGRPISSPAGNCITCLFNTRKMLGKMFLSDKALATQQYFGAGKCNAHSVGMCMMLEKIRTCSIEINDTGRLETGAASRKKRRVTTPQIDFCDSFKDTTLELTHVNGQVQCPAVFMETMKAQNVSVKPLSEEGITTFDLKAGCHEVRKAMYNFYETCQQGAKKSLSKSVLDMFKAQKYGKDVWEPKSVHEAARKCRALFSCPDEEDLPENPKNASPSFEWRDLSTDIQQIINEVDDFSGSPQSMTASTATYEIVKLLEETTVDFGELQASIDHVYDKKKKMRKWGKTLGNIFHINLWDDRCFNRLAKPVDDWKGKEGRGATKIRLANLYTKLGRPALSGHPRTAGQFRFFEALAKAIGYENWSKDKKSRCKIIAPELSEEPDYALAPQKQKKLVESRVKLFVITDTSKWQKDTEDRKDSEKQHKRPWLRLETIDGYKALFQQNDGHWEFEACTSPACSSVPKGTRVTRIEAKQAFGATVGGLRTAISTLVQSMHSVYKKDEVHGKPTPAKAAAALLKDWIAAFKQNGSPSVPTYDGSTFASSLKDLLSQDPALKRSFKAKGWIIKKASDVDKKKERFRLTIDGEPIARNTELKKIRNFFVKWEESSFRTTMSGISSVVSDIMYGFPKTTILKANSTTFTWKNLGNITAEMEAGISKLTVWYETEVTQ
eukprot:TRINITY_DN5499_c0_g2_i1.p1 TRINITY_DN5499_c0_g2~~TRINITY_DN5499_c0_g2_i1.p1  ORF type:complete len:1069 (-),score=216.45 TRINITY_DN5499_c0_g2_i1:61-3267(-)